MFFNSGIESFCNDGFEGSDAERQIFREVFSGHHTWNDRGSRSPAASISECTFSKNTSSSICSNTDISLLTSLSSPKEFCLPGSIDLSDDARGNSALRCFSDDFSVQEMSDFNACLKQKNLSVEKTPGTVIDEKVLNSSLFSCESVFGRSPHGADSISHTVTFPVVESFHQGVAWNYCMLKQNVPWERGASVGFVDLLNCRFLGSSGNLGKELAIASPVSQEGYASRLLVASPSSCAGGQLDYCAPADEKKIDYDNSGLHLSNSVETEAVKDPRRLLLSHALDLLKDAGWLVTKHKRPCRSYLESKYRSPAGRSFREFSKVWKACGEIMLADRFVLVEQNDGKRWNNISLFFSDLYDTLLSLKKGPNQSDVSSSLIRRWNILNPFVATIFIDKKIGMLRKGEVVEAREALIIDKYEKRNVVLGLRRADDKNRKRGNVLASKHGDVNVKKFAQGQLSGHCSHPAESKRDTVLGLKCGDLKAKLLLGGQFPGLFSDWHHPSGSEVTFFSGKANGFSQQSHDEYFSQYSWHGTEGTARLLSGTSFYMPAVDGNYLAATAGGIQGSTEPWNENENRNPLSKLDAEPGLSNDAAANVLPGLSNDSLLLSSASVYSHPDALATVSSHSDGKENFLPNYRENVERRGHLAEDMPIVAWRREDELTEDQETDKMRHLMTSQVSCLDCHHSCFSPGCKLSNILSQNADLVDSDGKHNGRTEFLFQQDEPESSVFRTADIIEQPGNGNDSNQCSVVDVVLKRKTRRKSKKISEIKSTQLHQTQIIGQTSDKAEPLDVDISLSHSELNQMLEPLTAAARSEGSCKSFLSFPEHRVEKKWMKQRKIRQNCYNLNKGRKRSRKCEIDDDDLLVSAIIKNKETGASPGRSKPKMKGYRSRVRRMMKSKNGGCRLLPRQVGKGGKLSAEGKLSLVGARTVLSWLIDSGVISPNDVIQYRDPENKTVVKDGRVTMDGIICNCCNKVLSVTRFKIHAGFKLNRPCLNLFMESGEPLTLCELQAWSSEYMTRKTGKLTHQADENDQNDDSCGLCGDGGELICCDNCPSTFHQACLLTEDLPEGNWYCANCTCRVCGDLVDAFSSDGRKCSQCEHKYHGLCMKEKELDPVASDAWFCSRSCQEVHSGLHSRVGLINHISDGYSWTLLRCIHDDQKLHSAQKFALKAECNSKLAVALSILEECFASMVDPRTGIDMIPHVLYNWGSDFARVNFQGFYTMVLEKDDVLITAASLRLHGVAVAEMPLIATCSKYRRQGMCRRLMTALEELLISFKVEKLVIAAIPELVETWTEGFGFKIVEKDEKQSLNGINLMVFPGTILLKKPLFQIHNSDTQTVAGHEGQDKFSPSGVEPKSETEQPAEDCCTRETDLMMGIDLVEATSCEKAGELLPTEANTRLIQGSDPPDLELAAPEEDRAIKSEHKPQGETCRKDAAVLGEETETDSREEMLMPEESERDDETKIIDPVHKDDAVFVGPEIAA